VRERKYTVFLFTRIAQEIVFQCVQDKFKKYGTARGDKKTVDNLNKSYHMRNKEVTVFRQH
jgi:hypothetical protein